MRKRCPECKGDGKSRDPMWKACFACCGRGEIPTRPEDVIEADIGMGVGLGIEYSMNGMNRLAVYLSVDGRRNHRIAWLPPTPGWGFDTRQMCELLFKAWQTAGRELLSHAATADVIRPLIESWNEYRPAVPPNDRATPGEHPF